MYKGLVSEIALEVGNSSAMVLNQLYQWVKEKNKQVVYRTNEQIKNDLCGLLSTATIQRAKKKLVDAGYLTISFDKGLNRVTHYTLTTKALTLLGAIKEEVVKQATVVKETVVKTVKKVASVVVNNKTNDSMKESFNEQGTRSGKHPIPKHLLDLIKGKKSNVNNTKVLDNADEGLSDDDWNNIDLAQTKKQNVNDYCDNSSGFSGLSGTLYKCVPNIDAFEKKRMMSESARVFNEDY